MIYEGIVFSGLINNNPTVVDYFQKELMYGDLGGYAVIEAQRLIVNADGEALQNP